MSDSSPLISNVLGSAAASVLSRTCTHPLDTAKARIQAPSMDSHTPYSGPMDAIRRTARTEGLSGLYRGFGAAIVGGTPGTVLYLCSYDFVKKKLTVGDRETAQIHFAAGMIAEAIACIIYVPVDVIKERMQVQHLRTLNADQSAGNTKPQNLNYANSLDALQKIVKFEGFVGLYRGYGSTLLSFGTFSAFYFVFYEQCKDIARRHCQWPSDEKKLPISWILFCSASSGALASWLTSPLDMAKLRLQVTVSHIHGPTSSIRDVNYSGMLECLRRSFQEGGVNGLFRGAGARVLHYAPATMITMTAYETCRSYIDMAL